MSRTYAGIGSRKTPADICSLMEAVAQKLRDDAWLLRSGHAQGADLAFEKGAADQSEIYLPWQGFNGRVPIAGAYVDKPTPEAIKLACELHPRGDRLADSAKLLHGRNCHQVLGLDLDDPVKFVLCFTENGSLDGSESNTGGTGQALRLAAKHDITVFNLARPDHRERVEKWIAA